jgi:N-acetylglutamate synthase-like GNAT family acetyltransferase
MIKPTIELLSAWSPNHKQASQIAALLNKYNHLIGSYTGQDIIAKADRYLCLFSTSGDIIACIELVKVQWYQLEIRHLVVIPTQIRKGYAQSLLSKVEEIAREKRVHILQCTARKSNLAANTLFLKCNFIHSNTFSNPATNNIIFVWQKCIGKDL